MVQAEVAAATTAATRRSNIGSLIRMAAQVPAWQRSRVREQRVHARLGLRRVENKLRLAVLLQDGRVVVHDDRSVGAALGGDSNLKYRKVQSVGEKRHSHDKENSAQEDSPELVCKITRRLHGRDYKPVDNTRVRAFSRSLPARETLNKYRLTSSRSGKAGVYADKSVHATLNQSLLGSLW